MSTLSPAIAAACFRRDGFKCRHCRERDGLHPHHVIYKSHGGPDALNNLLTLCWQCHRALHDGFLLIEVRALLQNDLNVRFERRKGWKPI